MEICDGRRGDPSRCLTYPSRAHLSSQELLEHSVLGNDSKDSHTSHELSGSEILGPSSDLHAIMYRPASLHGLIQRLTTGVGDEISRGMTISMQLVRWTALSISLLAHFLDDIQEMSYPRLVQGLMPHVKHSPSSLSFKKSLRYPVIMHASMSSS